MAKFSRPGVLAIATVKGIKSRIFKVIEVHVSAGPTLLDHAVVKIDLGDPQVQRYVQGLNLSTLTFGTPDVGNVQLIGQEMTIQVVNNTSINVIHWGKITGCEVDMGQDEGITLVSRMEHAHFGNPLPFQRVWDPIGSQVTYADHDVVFNPEIRNQIIGNRRVSRYATGLQYPIFIDPDSVFTSNASTFQGTVPRIVDDNLTIDEIAAENWNLIEAVQYICNECNPKQKWVLNPSLDDLNKVLPDSRSILKNHKLLHGLYLPEALHQLLEPYGFQIAVDYQSGSSRKLKIIQNGVGPKKQIRWQAAGETLDPPKQNADQIQLQYDISQAINQITATGGFTEIEATWELKPAWTKDQDQTPLGKLFTENPDWDKHPEYHRIWRDWVLDEAGDYGRAWQKMPASSANPILTDYFRTVWGNDHPPVVAKRRKFHPMLTRGVDGQPLGEVGGCKVEWFDPNGANGADWYDLAKLDPTMECRLLEHECGIKFTASVPPVRIHNQGANARIRITAVVRSDTRIEASVPRRDTSVNPEVNERAIDVNTRFHARLMHPDSVYYSDVKSNVRDADLTDARSALQDFVNQARDAWDQAQCSGTIRLEGLDHQGEYSLGDLITGVTGRGVDWPLNTGSTSNARYPQVVGISYYSQAQKILLTVNEFKETDAFIASFVRKTKRLK